MGAMKLWHWVVIIVVLIVIFGAGKLPAIAKSIGQSAKVLKKEMRELQDDVPPEQVEGPAAGSRAESGARLERSADSGTPSDGEKSSQ